LHIALQTVKSRFLMGGSHWSEAQVDGLAANATVPVFRAIWGWNSFENRA